MKKQAKKLMALGLVIGLSVSAAMTSFAGQWKSEFEGKMWWYQNDDGSYPMNIWQTIGGKSYHFDKVGYLDTDTLTLDGYTVDANGAWIESIPKKSQAECDQYWHDSYIKMLINDYECGDLSDADIAEAAIWLLGEEEGKRTMEEIRNTHTYGVLNSSLYWQEYEIDEARQALRDAKGNTARKDAVYTYLDSQGYEISILEIVDHGYKYHSEYSSSPKGYVDVYTNRYIMTKEECHAVMNYMGSEETGSYQRRIGDSDEWETIPSINTAEALIELIEGKQ